MCQIIWWKLHASLLDIANFYLFEGMGKNSQVTIRRLEEAGESYNQAVLAANMRSKKELMAYLKTVTTATVSATADEQRDIVRGLVRDAVSAEIVALKTAISELHGEKRPGMSRYVGMAVISLVTAIMTSVITLALLKLVS